ncbi:hypothetical protein [Photobacterium piscicola]
MPEDIFANVLPDSIGYFVEQPLLLLLVGVVLTCKYFQSQRQ